MFWVAGWGKRWSGITSFLLKGITQKQCITGSHPFGHALVTWSSIAAREAENIVFTQAVRCLPKHEGLYDCRWGGVETGEIYQFPPKIRTKYYFKGGTKLFFQRERSLYKKICWGFHGSVRSLQPGRLEWHRGAIGCCEVFWRRGTPEHPGERSWGERDKKWPGRSIPYEETLAMKPDLLRFAVKVWHTQQPGEGCTSRKRSCVSMGVLPGRQWKWLQKPKPKWECERHRALEQVGFQGPSAS